MEANQARLIYLSTHNPKVERTESYGPILGLSGDTRNASKCRFMDFNSNGDLVCSDLGEKRTDVVKNAEVSPMPI